MPIQILAVDHADVPMALPGYVAVTLRALTSDVAGETSPIAGIYGADNCADRVDKITFPSKVNAPATGTAFVKSTAAGSTTVQAT